jgi:hypothetical protein
MLSVAEFFSPEAFYEDCRFVSIRSYCHRGGIAATQPVAAQKQC